MEAYKLTVTATSEGQGYNTTPCSALYWGSLGPGSVSSTMSEKGPPRPLSPPSRSSAMYTSYSDGCRTPGTAHMERPPIAFTTSTTPGGSASSAEWAPRALPPGAIPDGYWMLGTLGPVHMQTTEWEARKEKWLRQKAFGRAVNAVHMQSRPVSSSWVPQQQQQQRAQSAAVHKVIRSQQHAKDSNLDPKPVLDSTLEASECLLEEQGDADALARAVKRDAVAACALKL